VVYQFVEKNNRVSTRLVRGKLEKYLYKFALGPKKENKVDGKKRV
jgi:hypothetical protein